MKKPKDNNTTGAERQPPVCPRLVRRHGGAHYLGVSVQTFDALRLQGEIRPVPVPAARRQGELLRTPLFDVRDLDSLIDRWKENA